MTRWLELFSIACLVLLAVCAGASVLTAAAQLVAPAQIVAPAPCEQSVACLTQRVIDLREHREFLETQLALAKAMLQDAQRTLAAKEAEITTLKAGKP